MTKIEIKMIKVEINGLEFFVKSNISVLEACKYVGVTIPRFCYHETLSVAGNCRMCLVEISNSPKPVASCALPVLNNMKIFVNTPLVKKARENILETLLLNHPLDCPICDQGGECDLQDQTKNFGGDYSRFFFNKRVVEDKYCGPLIKTIMTRCIHCTRCVRFGTEIAGVEYLGTLNRGGDTEIGGYLSSSFNSEISGNVIDLCPVGALTSKPYSFKARPWELRTTESVDLTDGLGSNIYINFKESEIARILPKINSDLNDSIISDKARFYFDSNKTQRLHKLLLKENSAFNDVNWSDALNYFESKLKNSKSTLLLVNSELDFSSLILLKQLSFESRRKIIIKSINSAKTSKSNVYVSWLKSRINDLKKSSSICFIFSSNIRLECAILNSKLRLKHFNEDVKVFGLTTSFNSNFPVNFVNLSIDKFTLFLEGKDFVLSKLFLSSVAPIICLGENLSYRGFFLENTLNFLKKISPNCIFLNIQSTCNNESLSYLNCASVNKQDFLKAETVIAINLDNTLHVSKNLFNKDNIIWINTHYSPLASRSNLIIPIQTEFEEEKVHINLEERIQKTNKSISSIGSSRSLNKLLSLLLKKKDNVFNFGEFNRNILDNSYLFKKITPIFSNIKFLNQLTLSNSYFIQKNYPVKNLNNDFFCSNKMTKNSKTMLECSQEHRKDRINFN